MEPAGNATRDGAPTPGAAESAWRAHLALAGGLALCAAAFWFELRRALGGNALSWAYVFEWPLLGGFGVYAWWRVRHPRSRPREQIYAAMAPEFQRMRAAWEEHERSLGGGGAEAGSGDGAPPASP